MRFFIWALIAASWPVFQSSGATTFVEAWGWNFEGECNVPAGLTNALAISAGSDCSLALKSDHTVVAWGNNNIGQCNVPAGLTNVIAISAGMQRFALALKSDGTVVGWGNNGQGQLNIPPGLSNVTAIAAGNAHALALKNDGTVVSWGSTGCGQTNIPVGLSNVIAIAAYDNSMAVKADGTIVAWDCDGSGANSVPGGLGPVKALATKQHSLALKLDGTLAALGLNDSGEGTVPQGIANVQAIACGFSHNLVLVSGGTAIAWGFNRDGQGSIPAGLAGVSAVSAGGNHNLVITTIPLIKIITQPQSVVTNTGSFVNFQVNASAQVPLTYQWQKNGTNLSGQNGAALTIPNCQSSDAGNYAVVISHPTLTITSSPASLSFTSPTILVQPQNKLVTLGSSASLTVTAAGSPTLSYQWRKNGSVLGSQTSSSLTLSGIQPSDAGRYTVSVSNNFGGVISDPAVVSIIPLPYSVAAPNTVVSLGGPALPDGLDDVIAIAAGYGQQLAVHSNGTVAVWGNTINPPNPLPPGDLSNVVAVASGGIHSLALKSDGSVVGWGPSTPPQGLANVIAISSGHDFSLALKADGTAVAWGAGASSPFPNSNLVAVVAGIFYSLGLRNDGTLPSGIFLDFPGASNLIAIAGGDLNSFVMLRNDGTVAGYNTTIPTGLSNVVAISKGLALKSDGTIAAFGAANSTISATNVTAISGRLGDGLVLTHWPVILQPPQNMTVDGSTTAEFSVVATGAGPLGYQWRKDGLDIYGATESDLYIPNAQSGDAGTYDVVVSNDAGSIASLPATLSVNTSPRIPLPPAPQTVWVGMQAGFSVTASGDQPLSYQWRHNGTDIGGQTDSSLSFNSVQFGYPRV